MTTVKLLTLPTFLRIEEALPPLDSIFETTVVVQGGELCWKPSLSTIDLPHKLIGANIKNVIADKLRSDETINIGDECSGL